LLALLGLVLASPAGAAPAPPGFEFARHYDVPGSSMAVGTGDLNADGHLDLVTITALPHGLTVMLGDGQGEFERSDIEVSESPTGLALARIDDDETLDLVLLEHEAESISIMLGDGAGGFGFEARHPLPHGPKGVTTADFDGDGDTDLAVSHEDSWDVAVLVGDGTGRFAISTRTGVGHGAGAIVAGHFNGDGDPDLAVATFWTDEISILLGLDDGPEFAPPVKYGVGDGPASLVAGQCDGDSHLDLAVADFQSADLRLLAGDGTGYFTVGAPTAVATPTDLEAVDLDANGKSELLVVSEGLVRHVTNGPNGLELSDHIPMGFGAAGDLALGRFDSDDELDLVVTHPNASKISVLYPAGLGSDPDNTVSFGAFLLGIPSEPHTVTFRNAYAEPLTLPEISLSGDDAPDFTIVSDDCSSATLAPNGTYRVWYGRA
jgi:hypothetical protein